MPRANLIQIRGGTASAWTTANPVLAAREMGVETDTRKFKFGDGTTAWSSLAYAGGGSGSIPPLVDILEFGNVIDSVDRSISVSNTGTLSIGSPPNPSTIEIFGDGTIALNLGSDATGDMWRRSSGGLMERRTPVQVLGDIGAQAALGFTAENVANKATNFSTI